MPSTLLGIPYPASSAAPRVWEDLQVLAERVNGLLLPPPEVTAYGNGVNTIVSGAGLWGDLVSYNPVAVITNTDTSRGLKIQVTGSAWLSASGTNVRACVVASGGSLTIDGGPDPDGHVGWGEIAFQGAPASGAAYSQMQTGYTCAIPANTTCAFKFAAYRDAATGTTQVNYPVVRLTPLRWV